jgi:hypothetical protein
MKLQGAGQMKFAANAATDLTTLRGESITSSLWRYAWRNGLKSTELRVYCSTGIGYAEEGRRPNLKRQFDPDIFAAASGWVINSDEAALVEVTQRHHRSAWWCPQFRYCPLCLEQLYHSFWHQSLFFSHCPIDGAALLDRCYSCGTRTPAYGFYRRLLHRPYVCEYCRHPYSGVKLSLSARLAMQQRADEVKRALADVEHWWGAVCALRQELESMFAERRFESYAPWLHPETSARQWIVQQESEVHPPVTTTRTLPNLIILRWRVRLLTLESIDGIDEKHRYWDKRLDLAQQVYRATLKRLLKSISICRPFDEVDLQRHESITLDNLGSMHTPCNLHLLAFNFLRRGYELAFPEGCETPAQPVLDVRRLHFPFEHEFAGRIRICWRAQFIAEYASLYWWLVAVCDGRDGVDAMRRNTCTLWNTGVQHDTENGDLVSGSVAFPAVDGLNLTLFP